MGSENTSLDRRTSNALEAVYLAFAAPVPSVIEGCPCCITTRRTDALLTKPLRALSAEDLWRYVTGVFLTVGSTRDFRYLLPRILQVAIHDRSFVDTEIVLGKLALAEWQSWPERERRPIEEVISVWFDHALAQDLHELREGWPSEQAERVLCGAARAGLPLHEMLERLLLLVNEPVADDMRARFPKRLSGFWEEAPQGREELRAAL